MNKLENFYVLSEETADDGITEEEITYAEDIVPQEITPTIEEEVTTEEEEVIPEEEEIPEEEVVDEEEKEEKFVEDLLKALFPKNWVSRLILFIFRMVASVYAINLALKCSSDNTIFIKIISVLFAAVFTEFFLISHAYFSFLGKLKC